jgi:uncharacterized protein
MHYLQKLLQGLVIRIVDFSGRRPWIVIALCTLFLGATWGYATKLELRPDFLELLPTESPGFKAYVHQLGRVGGGATFTFVVESPDRLANQRFVDAVSTALQKKVAEREACEATCGGPQACGGRCNEHMVSYFENGTKDIQAFYRGNKWLFPSLKELEEVDNDLDRQIAIRSGLVSDLSSETPVSPAPSSGPSATPSAQATNTSNMPPKAPTTAPRQAPSANVTAPGPRPSAPTAPSTPSARSAASATPTASAAAMPAPTASAPAPTAPKAAPAFGLDAHRDRWESAVKKHDDFPTGYFASDDGKTMVVRVVSGASGTGGASGDRFLRQMDDIVTAINPKSLHPEMVVGYAGDIPNAKAEKDSIAGEALWATGLALLLVLSGIVFYFRSVSSLAIVAFPVFLGIGAAYAFATVAFGYVNTAGAFLGAIILGNGINYPIVLLSRYQEFRARGMDQTTARREAVLNAFRAELVGAAVAGIAYGSLTVTSFRGFSQFGMIGFFGMLLVWLAIIPVVPAMVSMLEGLSERFPRSPRWLWIVQSAPGPSGKGWFTRLVAKLTQRFSWAFVLLGLGATAALAFRLPQFMRDPWEYNFHNLGSKGSHQQSGAGIWTNKADAVFRGKLDISGARMLADNAAQIPALKAKMLANDAADPQGKLLEGVVTIDDFLPGLAPEQKAKLEVIERIRDRLTPTVMQSLPEDERKRVEEMMPPENLKPVGHQNLPPLIKRRFEERDGRLGTLFYVQYKHGVSVGDGRTVLRLAKTTDNVKLDDGTLVQTASRASVYAEMIRSITRDGPLATLASFLAVSLVVIVATHRARGAIAVLLSLLMSVVCTLGIAHLTGERLNFLNFIALPITFGIGCEYPFNIFDRARLLQGDVEQAVTRSGGAVGLCSYTTIVGYGALLIADQQAVQSFGRVAALGEIACIVMALLFLPSLLHVWRAAVVGTKADPTVASQENASQDPQKNTPEA